VRYKFSDRFYDLTPVQLVFLLVFIHIPAINLPSGILRKLLVSVFVQTLGNYYMFRSLTVVSRLTFSYVEHHNSSQLIPNESLCPVGDHGIYRTVFCGLFSMVLLNLRHFVEEPNLLKM